MTSSPDEREALIEDVLVVVEAIPAGRVLSYGDIARLVGCGPRQVGAILRDRGGGVPWWRVTNHRGDMHSPERAIPHWQAEGIPIRADQLGCRISACRADANQLGDHVADSPA